LQGVINVNGSGQRLHAQTTVLNLGLAYRKHNNDIINTILW